MADKKREKSKTYNEKVLEEQLDQVKCELRDKEEEIRVHKIQIQLLKDEVKKCQPPSPNTSQGNVN